MSGFEVAGIVLAGPVVVGQLIKTSLEGYRMFSEVQECGKDVRRHQRAMDFQRIRLMDWTRLISEHGGDLSALIDARKYQLALETLVYIAAIFADVDHLEKKYGIRRSLDFDTRDQSSMGYASEKTASILERPLLEEKASGSGSRNPLRKMKKWFKSDKGASSSRPGSALGSTVINDNAKPALPSNRKSMVSTVIVSGTALLLGGSNDSPSEHQFSLFNAVELQQEDIETTAVRYQQTISTFRQYEWILSAKAELGKLVEDLKNYTDELYMLTSHIERGNGE